MSIQIETVVVTLARIACGKCGGVYAISERYHQERQNNGGGWYCPYCRVEWGFFGETAVQRAQRERDAARAEANRQFERARIAARERDHHWTERKKLQTRHSHLRQRVKNGVCPCCHRHFRNVEDHIKTKHPTFTP
jgi:hypothetical protein